MFFSAKFCPFFRVFRVQGPISITSRACERSNDGPEDPKCPKNGQNEAEMNIFQLNNRNVRNLKISMLHIVLWHFLHIGTKPVFLGTLPITISYEYSLPT